MNESIFNILKNKKAKKEAENAKKEAEKREEEEKELREKKKKAEEDRKAKQQKIDEDLVKNMIESIITYINSNYKKCDFSFDDKYFLIEKDKLVFNDVNFSFKLKYDYKIIKPTFNIFIKLGIKKYDYIISGEYYLFLKVFLNNNVIPWYVQKIKSEKEKEKEKEKDNNQFDDDYWDYYEEEKYNYKKDHPDEEFNEDDFEDYYNKVYYEWYGENPPNQQSKQQSKPKTNSEFTPEELAKKKKTYNLLLNTLKSHEDNLKKIQNWKSQNIGKVHPDESLTKTQIESTRRKITEFKIKYKFEGYQFIHIKNKKLFEKNSGFEEVTFTFINDEFDLNNKGNEIMFDILEDGTVIGIYCYNDQIPKYYDKNDNIRYMVVKDGKNPLFKHISVNKNNIKKLLDLGIYPSLETEDDWLLVNNMLTKYKLSNHYSYGWEY